jgi:hypothetical protein
VKKFQELRDAIVQKYKLKMMQQILFEFAVGDAERSLLVNSAFPERIIGKTDLGKYEDELNIRIGLTSLSIDEQPVNLIRMFDDGNEKSETIKNIYTKQLRNNFRDSEKDLFTTFLPFELTSLLDENDRVDGWKKKSIVDKLFRDNVKIDNNEIDKIFKPIGDQPDIGIISLLTRFEELEKRSTLKEVLDTIVQKINEYCQSTYTKNTENEIGSFLNWNIKDAFTNSSDKIKEGLLNNISEVTFPVHTENIGGLHKVGPYVNVNPSLESFVNSVLKLKSDKIVKCPNLEESKLVLVRYVGGIDYKEIYGNELNQYVYLHRNIDLFKPFLNKNWNKKVRGPWGDTEEYILTANINSFDYKLEYIEALALLIGMDLLLQKNKALADRIFVNDPKLTKNKNVINRSPIHYITQLKQFVYYPDVKINDQAVPGVDKLWIEDSGIKSNKKLLPLSQDLTKKLLSFRGTIKELRSDEQFTSMLSRFVSVISFHYQEIESILKNEIENIETPFPQIYTTIKRRGQKEISNYHHEDLETAQKFDDIVKRVLSRLFGL